MPDILALPPSNLRKTAWIAGLIAGRGTAAVGRVAARPRRALARRLPNVPRAVQGPLVRGLHHRAGLVAAVLWMAALDPGQLGSRGALDGRSRRAVHQAPHARLIPLLTRAWAPAVNLDKQKERNSKTLFDTTVSV